MSEFVALCFKSSGETQETPKRSLPAVEVKETSQNHNTATILNSLLCDQNIQLGVILVIPREKFNNNSKAFSLTLKGPRNELEVGLNETLGGLAGHAKR